jgi:SAM-dependent methyltransferase
VKAFGKDQRNGEAEAPPRVRHTSETIRAAAEEFLTLLDKWDEPDPDGYFETLPISFYFQGLIEDQPGAWHTLIRNMIYGLDRFPSGRVLDIGCGHGLQSFVFARHGFEVIGLDTAKHRTAVSNRIAEAADMPWLQYVTGDAREEVGRFEGSALWMHRSFHHIPEKADFDASAIQFFRQAHRSLDPNGVMVFTTSNATGRSLLPGVSRGQHTAKHLRRLIEQADFEVTDISYRGFLTGLPLKVRPRNAGQIDERLAKVPGLRRLGGGLMFAATRR